MKSILFYSVMNLFFFNTPTLKTIEITEETVVAAMAKEDFNFISMALDKRLLNPNEKYNGKPLLFYAIDYDSAEVVNLLVRRGARLDYVDAEGYSPKEYAKRTQKIYALAEIIVITA